MEDKYCFTSASEWFYCPEHEEDNVNVNINENSIHNDKLSRSVSTVNVSVAVGRIIISDMAPVTTFCATVPANNHDSFVINNLNRTKSLDNLNFEEKRQIIASTLSLADIITSSGATHISKHYKNINTLFIIPHLFIHYLVSTI